MSKTGNGPGSQRRSNDHDAGRQGPEVRRFLCFVAVQIGLQSVAPTNRFTPRLDPLLAGSLEVWPVLRNQFLNRPLEFARFGGVEAWMDLRKEGLYRRNFRGL